MVFCTAADSPVSAACPVLLNETEQYREQDNDGDDHGLERMAEETRDDRASKQNQNQDVLKLSRQGAPRRLS